jgi:hypothetical protein
MPNDLLMTHYFQHALNCGINMTCKLAMPIDDCVGYMVMHRVDDPVSLRPLVQTGVRIDQDVIEMLKEYGVDYVVVFWHKIIDGLAA